MKDKIHPQYYTNAKVSCACGNAWETGSTEKEIRVEICSKCHPFYTGKQKLVDTAGRVEKFTERLAKKTAVAKVRKGRKVKKAMRASKRKSIAEKKGQDTTAGAGRASNKKSPYGGSPEGRQDTKKIQEIEKQSHPAGDHLLGENKEIKDAEKANPVNKVNKMVDKKDSKEIKSKTEK